MQYGVVSVKWGIVVSGGEVRGDFIRCRMWSERPLCRDVRSEMCVEYWCVVRGVGVRCESGWSMVVCV